MIAHVSINSIAECDPERTVMDAPPPNRGGAKRPISTLESKMYKKKAAVLEFPSVLFEGVQCVPEEAVGDIVHAVAI